MTTFPQCASSGRRSRHAARAAVLLATTALTSPLAIASALAQNLPTGGSVAAGSAVISQPSATQLTITQSSQSAVVNYQSFSVGQGNSVNFVQPNASSAILNRVTGSTPSSIAGSLTANGSVYLVNPNGIAITSTGTVNTSGGFVASTLGISDSDFMSGKRTFTGNGASAGVSNEGAITVGRGGYAALIGGTVSNSGSINVPLGKVGLGSGEQATLDFSGDGFLQVAVPTAAGGKTALIRNAGSITADGGSVVIAAATAREAARNAINISGTVQARSIGGRNGAISIGGGDGGNVRITGRLIATSRVGHGGTIAVTGKTIKLKGATVDASGATGGGTVNIGGGRQGTGPLQRAQATTIDAATVIKADATASGNGGNVTVWSDGATAVYGTISARGGTSGGDGGQIETSGHSLDFAGIRVDASAVKGAGGTWLLDPTDLIVDAAAATTINGVLGGGTGVTLQTFASGAPSGPAGSTNTTAAGNGDIIINSSLSWATSATLTLNAYNAIAINAPITVGGAGGVALIYNTASPTNLTFRNGASIDYGATNNGGTLSINNQSYTLVYTMAQLDAVDAKEAVGGAAVTRYGAGLSGRYAIAGNLDASGTTYTTALIGDAVNTFTGTLEGLGHTITGLTINAPGTSFLGLVGDSFGTLRDIGLVGGSVSGANAVGALVGYNEASGTITQAYSSGSVSGSSSVGGLVGQNDAGKITRAYTTGSVSGSSEIGGLVGLNSGGTITQAYATGNVSGSINVGGLAGDSNGTITQSYSTAGVSGSTAVGGLVGGTTGTVTNSYWDTQTSGQSTSAGGTGLTTAQLQSGTLPAGFSSSAWSTGSGLYPYLASFFPNGVQAVSGIAYKDAGATPAASGSTGAVTVSLDVGGSQVGQATTGANGYYYIAVANGTLATGASLLASTPTNGALSTNAATLATSAGAASQGNVNLYGNALTVATAATLLSQAPSLAGARGSATTTAGTDSAAASVVAAITTAGYLATGASFSIDTATTVGSGSSLFVATHAGSLLTVDAAVTVADTGSLALLSGGALRINAPIQVRGASAVTLTYDTSSVTNLSFASGAGLSYAAADGSAVSSSAGGALTINGQAYTLLYSMADIDGIDGTAAISGGTIHTQAGGLSGRYAIAGNLDAAGTTYTTALIGDGSNLFSGTLEGLGHTITGLTITAPGTSFIGLVGDSSGTLRDIGLVGGSVSGDSAIGALVGYNEAAGRIVQVYSSGNVSGSNNVGGLVGTNDHGTITQSYSMASVSGSSNIGGLVGTNSVGTIAQVYATGHVSGSSNVGGLVGINSGGTITQSYSTVSVSGSSAVGGLVGGNSGTVTASYWDTQTSGQSTSAGGTGLTTVQFQSGAASGLGSAFSGGASGLYPYLTSFYPNGVQAVSGIAYKDAGTTPAASGSAGAVTVSLDANGGRIGQATTGANGYYYIAVANGTLANGASLLASTPTNGSLSVNAATLATSAGAAKQADVNLYGNTLAVMTSATLLSQATSLAGARASATTTAGTDSAAASVVGALTAVGYLATGASFSIDAATTVASGSSLLVRTLTGTPLTVDAAVTVSDTGSLALLSGGALRINAPIAAQGAAGVSFAYDASLPTNLSFASGAGLTYVSSTGSALPSSAGGALTINGQAYTLLYSMADIDGIDGTAAISGGTINTQAAGLSGRYAIAGNLDATGTTYTAAVVGTGGGTFSGTLDGLGHSITGLTINAANYIGLVAQSSGTLRDIGLIGGRVSGTSYVGDLVGMNTGSITLAYATGSVSGTSNTGGLVGQNAGGTITQSTATGSVSGFTTAGGLVGLNGGGGVITQSYATGAVSGSNTVGGLVGQNGNQAGSGTITQSYATGRVSTGSIYIGGLVGYSNGGTVTSSYWDRQTSGQSTSAGGTGLTTTQFQSGSASGLGAAFSGGTGGIYPYLTNFYPTGVQAVSGIAYKSNGAVLASGSAGAAVVNVAAGGTLLGSAATGANGYYYVLLPAGTLTGGRQAVAYTLANGTTGSANAATYVTAMGGTTVAGSDIHGGWQIDQAGAGIATLSALNAADAGAAGSLLTGLALANRDIITGATSFTLDAATSLTGTLVLDTGGTVTQSASINANALLLKGGGSFTLTDAANSVATVAANAATLSLANAGSLATGSVSDAAGTLVHGVTATGAVSLATTGALTIASGAAVSGASAVLSAGGAFINNAGANAVTATSGRWLVYSANPAGDTFGGLDSGNTATWGTVAGGAVTATGNRYVFALQPTLTVTSTNDSKVYGADVTAQVAGDYTITGYDAGVSGAYLGDTAATALTGAPSVTSAGSAATAGVAGAPHAITAAAGTLATSGYAIQYVSSGQLTVTPRAITVTADAQSRAYGDANPALTYTIGGLGLVNGDALSGSLATSATTASNVGSYAIAQGTLAASSNYSVSYSGAYLTVIPRALTVTADAQSRAYDDANPALTYAVGGLGLINGDALTGGLATTATAASNAGTYAITQGNLAASSNYALTYVGALLTVEPAVQLPSIPSSPVPQGAPAIDPSALASRVVRDDFRWIALPGGVTPLVGGPPQAAPLGGVFYSDPRFDRILICFGGSVSAAASCFVMER